MRKTVSAKKTLKALKINFKILVTLKLDDIKIKEEFEEIGLFKDFAAVSSENFHKYVQKGFKDIKHRGKMGN